MFLCFYKIFVEIICNLTVIKNRRRHRSRVVHYATFFQNHPNWIFSHSRGWEFIFIYLNFTYAVAKFDFARWFVENVGHSQRLWNCVKSQIFQGYPGAGGTIGKGLRINFHVSQFYLCCGKFELARWLVEKVGQRQRLCNCVNIQIFEGYPEVGGTDRKGVVNFFDRAQPYLCCGQIWTRQMSCGKSWRGGRDEWRRASEFFFVDLNLTYMLWLNLNSPGDLWKKLDSVKDCIIVWIVTFWGLPTGKGRVEEGGLSIFFIDLNPIYVLVQLELGIYANWLVTANFKCISIVQIVPLMLFT